MKEYNEKILFVLGFKASGPGQIKENMGGAFSLTSLYQYDIISFSGVYILLGRGGC